MSDNEHAPIRTPKQLVGVITGFFLVIVIGIILLVTFVTSGPSTGAGSNAQTADAVTDRIAPVAEQGYKLEVAQGPKVAQAGDAVYNTTCAACHGTGAAGAPKMGDAGAWGARLAQGYDTLVQHAVNGIRAMPAKGGNTALSDLEVARAVVFMANQSGAKFQEPAAPAEAPAAQ